MFGRFYDDEVYTTSHDYMDELQKEAKARKAREAKMNRTIKGEMTARQWQTFGYGSKAYSEVSMGSIFAAYNEYKENENWA